VTETQAVTIDPGSKGPTAHQSRSSVRRIRILLGVLVVVLGALQTRAGIALHVMSSDGIAYLDIADAYWRGDWETAINGSWSPLYSWILGGFLHTFKPSPYHEAAVVQVANFVVYLLAFAIFRFFWSPFADEAWHGVTEPTAKSCLPAWAWAALGDSLFLWLSLEAVKVWRITPDMVAMGLIFLMAGLSHRICRGYPTSIMFFALGATIGLGYLATPWVGLIGLVFFALSFFSSHGLRRVIPLALACLVGFGAVAGPFILALSRSEGCFTFGHSLRLQYLWGVNQVPRAHWQGDSDPTRTPAHPTRRLSQMPPLYEFGSPIGGTYPVLHDPSYWYAGVGVRFDVRKQVAVLVQNAQICFDLFVRRQGGWMAAVIILILIGKGSNLRLNRSSEGRQLVVASVAGLLLLGLFPLELRFVAGLIGVFWAGLFAGLPLAVSPEAKRIHTAISIAMLTIIGLDIAAFHLGSHLSRGIYYPEINEVRLLPEAYGHIDWQVAQELKRLHVDSGSSVATIGSGAGAYWARLAGVRIVAEVPDGETEWFWRLGATPSLLNNLANYHVKALIARKPPLDAWTQGWTKVEGTTYVVRLLDTPARSGFLRSHFGKLKGILNTQLMPW
jgi:hypothetical protein